MGDAVSLVVDDVSVAGTELDTGISLVAEETSKEVATLDDADSLTDDELITPVEMVMLAMDEASEELVALSADET